MSREQKGNREGKKKAQKNLKEKRADKKAKHAEKTGILNIRDAH